MPPSPSQRSMSLRVAAPSAGSDHRRDRTGHRDGSCAQVAPVQARVGWRPVLNRRERPPDGKETPMTTAVIVDAVRTAGGKRNGKLRNWHAVDLASESLKALPSATSSTPPWSTTSSWAASCRSASSRSTSAATPCSPRAGPSRCRPRPIDRQCGSLPAGDALRRPGRHGRRLRRRRRRRRRGHDAHPHGLLDRARASASRSARA